MATKLEIYNMALSTARGQGSLQSLSQKTRGREECDKWYNLVVDVTQEAAYWPCCKVRYKLTGKTELVRREWLYSYALPPNFLRPWYMDNYARFALESDGTNTEIYTNYDDAVLYYARRVTDTARWTASMTQAVVYGLGYKVSEGLTGKGDLVERLLGLANGYLAQAQSVAINQSGEDTIHQTDPEWIVARGAGMAPVNRFFYPYGDVWVPVGGSPDTARLSSLAAAPSSIL